MQGKANIFSINISPLDSLGAYYLSFGKPLYALIQTVINSHPLYVHNSSSYRKRRSYPLFNFIVFTIFWGGKGKD